MEDFGRESQGEMIIEFLQMRHKCIITLQDSAAEQMYDISCFMFSFYL